MRDGEGTRRHPLDPLFAPRSIAVVGASADPGKRGHQIVRALGQAGYRGAVHPVNPRGGSLLGHQVFPSVASLPDGVELAVVCTPADTAPGIVRACGERGIAGAVVLAVGFAESGPEGAERQRLLVDAARETGVRVVGPNTSGLLNLHAGANLIGAPDVRPGGLALLVQSGNMALALMNEATRRSRAGISICVGIGNGADVGFAEALDYLGGHPDTRGVIVYAEGLPDARRFLATASVVSRTKPIVMIKSGRSERAAATAASHTGAVAGPYDRFSAGLRQAGVVEARRTDELFHLGETLAAQPAPTGGTGIAILSDGGGQGTLAVDALGDAGAPLAELGETTRARLRTLLGPAAAVGNPVDLAGAADADPTVFARALDALVEDRSVGTVLLVGLFGGYAIRFDPALAPAEERAAAAMAARARATGTGLVVHTMYAPTRSTPLLALSEARVPVVESLDVACRSVAELQLTSERLARATWRDGAGGARPGRVDGRTGPAAAPEAATPAAETPPAAEPPPAHVERAVRERRGALTEPEARALLEGAGVPFPAAHVVHDAEEAVRAWRDLSGPVAVKVVSAALLHKSDAGGVALGLDGEDAVRAAFGAVTGAAEEAARVRGLAAGPPTALVTRMAVAPVVELLVGVRRDAGLGPVLTVGEGGVRVEVSRDVSHRVLPVDDTEMHAMLDELRIAPLLAGHRGTASVDREAVVAVARAVARLVEATPTVRDVEINPLFAYADRVEPIDARVILDVEA